MVQFFRFFSGFLGLIGLSVFSFTPAFDTPDEGYFRILIQFHEY